MFLYFIAGIVVACVYIITHYSTWDKLSSPVRLFATMGLVLCWWIVLMYLVSRLKSHIDCVFKVH